MALLAHSNSRGDWVYVNTKQVDALVYDRDSSYALRDKYPAVKIASFDNIFFPRNSRLHWDHVLLSDCTFDCEFIFETARSFVFTGCLPPPSIFEEITKHKTIWLNVHATQDMLPILIEFMHLPKYHKVSICFWSCESPQIYRTIWQLKIFRDNFCISHTDKEGTPDYPVMTHKEYEKIENE